MGNETSTTALTNRDKKKQLALAQRQQTIPPQIEAIDRRARYAAPTRPGQAPSPLARILEEERSRYYTPPVPPLVDPRTNRIQLPATETPDPASVKNWNAAWAALLVRCGAIAPFSSDTMSDEDPLSANDFVKFMLDTISAANSGTSTGRDAAPATAAQSTTTTSGVAQLAPPPPRPSDQPEPTRTASNDSGWIVVESQHEHRPRLPVTAPWPREECVVCLMFTDRGLNHCARCNAGICSNCLLHLIKPVRIDLSDGAVKAAMAAQRQVANELAALISRYERQKSPPPELIDLPASIARNVGAAVSNALDDFSASISQLHGSIVNGSNKNKDSNSNNSSRQSSKTGSPNIRPVQASDDIDDPDLAQAKRLLELVRRNDVTGMFLRPRDNNTNGNNNDDDAEEDRYTDLARRQDSDRLDGDIFSVHPASPHHWPVPASYAFDDCRTVTATTNTTAASDPALMLEQCRIVVQRAIRVESRGSCPYCRSTPAAWVYTGRKPRVRMLEELAAIHGTDAKVLELFAVNNNNNNATNKSKQQHQPHVGNRGADEDVVWIRPSDAENADYELSIALAISAVADVHCELAIEADPENKKTMDRGELLASCVNWASPCEVCRQLNWNERKCRVCGTVRSARV